MALLRANNRSSKVHMSMTRSRCLSRTFTKSSSRLLVMTKMAASSGDRSLAARATLRLKSWKRRPRNANWPMLCAQRHTLSLSWRRRAKRDTKKPTSILTCTRRLKARTIPRPRTTSNWRQWKIASQTPSESWLTMLCYSKENKTWTMSRELLSDDWTGHKERKETILWRLCKI